MKPYLTNDDITLRPAEPDELQNIYQLMTKDLEWTKFNGPYFGYSTPSISQFEQTTFQRLLAGDDILLIEFSGRVIGSVNYYWECEATRWLEAGIVIYDSECWCKGIGQKALTPWIDHLFRTKEIERVGMTTWSGNPRMMACAEKMGFKQEARLRKVRFYQGVYYDSVKYGVLREEWQKRRFTM